MICFVVLQSIGCVVLKKKLALSLYSFLYIIVYGLIENGSQF
jgi:hypothetical protein